MTDALNQAAATELTTVVLAGERPGGNALAQAFASASSLTLDLNGRAVIDWTLTAVANSSVDHIVLVGPGDAALEHPAVQPWLKHERVSRIQPAAGPAASAVLGANVRGVYPLLLTAADHALLQASDIDDFCAYAQARAEATGADLVVGLVEYAQVQARFPHSRRTLLKFADGACCGSNLFWLATANSARVLELWSEFEALRKQPWKIAWGIGLGACVRYLLGRLSVADAFAALSTRAGAHVTFCKLSSAELAVDVDSVADLELAQEVLRERAASALAESAEPTA